VSRHAVNARVAAIVTLLVLAAAGPPALAFQGEEAPAARSKITGRVLGEGTIGELCERICRVARGTAGR